MLSLCSTEGKAMAKHIRCVGSSSTNRLLYFILPPRTSASRLFVYFFFFLFHSFFLVRFVHFLPHEKWYAQLNTTPQSPFNTSSILVHPKKDPNPCQEKCTSIQTMRSCIGLLQIAFVIPLLSLFWIPFCRYIAFAMMLLHAHTKSGRDDAAADDTWKKKKKNAHMNLE